MSNDSSPFSKGCCNADHKCKVLIVDDVPTVRVMLRLMLNTMDSVEVVGEAGDGQEAVDAVSVLKPDVVILDVAMPVMSGIEAVGPISKMPNPPRIIIHSGYDAIVKQDALDAGADGFLAKGARLDEIREAVTIACGQHVAHAAQLDSIDA